MTRVSRIGKLPIKFSNDIKVDIKGTIITFVKNENKKIYDFGNNVKVFLQSDKIIVENADENNESFIKFVGLHRSNLNNIVIGLTEGFKVVLEYNGVGYKAAVVKNLLVLTLGYSHDIAIKIPEGIQVVPEKPNLIVLKGTEKAELGTFAAFVKSLRKTEPYKGKGIKYEGENILRKEGKKK